MDPIADFLTRIRNAHLKHKTSIDVPYSRLKKDLASLLKKEGYIRSCLVMGDTPAKRYINIRLKYYLDKPVITSIKRVSTPGQRIYVRHNSLPKVLGGLGIAVVSTSKGLMTAKEARKQKLGGELMCEVY